MRNGLSIIDSKEFNVYSGMNWSDKFDVMKNEENSVCHLNIVEHKSFVE